MKEQDRIIKELESRRQAVRANWDEFLKGGIYPENPNWETVASKIDAVYTDVIKTIKGD